MYRLFKCNIPATKSSNMIKYISVYNNNSNIINNNNNNNWSFETRFPCL